MNDLNLPAILLILGFVFILAASSVGPPRLYQESSVERQLELIAEHSASWVASNILFALAGLASAGGLILFSSGQWPGGNKWLHASGAALFLIGAIAYTIFLYRRTVDPASLFKDYSFSTFTVLLLGSLLLGLLFYGVAFLQAGYPGWLGVSTIAGMVLIGGAALLFPAQFFNFFPPQALFLFTLLAGIVMWRQ